MGLRIGGGEWRNLIQDNAVHRAPCTHNSDYHFSQVCDRESSPPQIRNCEDSVEPWFSAKDRMEGGVGCHAHPIDCLDKTSPVIQESQEVFSHGLKEQNMDTSQPVHTSTKGSDYELI